MGSLEAGPLTDQYSWLSQHKAALREVSFKSGALGDCNMGSRKKGKGKREKGKGRLIGTEVRSRPSLVDVPEWIVALQMVIVLSRSAATSSPGR
jgi:hypothetical protein